LKQKIQDLLKETIPEEKEALPLVPNDSFCMKTAQKRAERFKTLI
jgi:hypothetical protein